MQGSGIGPTSYVVNSSDLKVITPGNSWCKYADDTYLIIPSANEDSRIAELENVEQWLRSSPTLTDLSPSRSSFQTKDGSNVFNNNHQ